MRIVILGGDGYLGWPTAMHFASRGDEVLALDNYLRRRLARETQSEPLLATPELPARCERFAALTGKRIDHRIVDCAEDGALTRIFEEFRPDAAVHFAEQPSAPYSMRGHDEARLTLLLKLGLKPHKMSDDRLAAMIEFARRHRDAIDPARILPRVSWR